MTYVVAQKVHTQFRQVNVDNQGFAQRSQPTRATPKAGPTAPSEQLPELDHLKQLPELDHLRQLPELDHLRKLPSTLGLYKDRILA
jgi:hypothetical protein